MMIEITSSTNPKFKNWQTLLTGKGLKDSDEFIVSGAKVTKEIIKNNPALIVAELVTDGQSGSFNPNQTFYLKKELFYELDIFGTKSPLLIVKQRRIEKFSSFELEDGPHLLLPFQDPANLGAAIRSASAFGCKNIWLSQESSNPHHPKSVRASSGTLFGCHFVRGEKLSDWIQQLVDAGLPVFGLDMQGESLPKTKFPKTYILVAGEEGQGLPTVSGLKKISIPMAQDVESLNAAASIAIALYEWKRHGI